MLPVVTFSTWAVLEMLARWSSCHARHGGFKDSGHRQGAGDLLVGFLSNVCEQHNGLAVPIDLDTSWAVLWPRPQVPKLLCVLQVDSKGVVLLAPFLLEVRSQNCPEGHWSKSSDFQRVCTELGSCPFVADLFQAVASVQKLSLLRLQLLWQLGARLQETISTCLTKPQGVLKVKVVSMEDSMDSAPVMDFKLVRYVASTRAVSAGQKNFSLATDKASVCGLGAGVQNLIFGLPSNIAFVGVPQAGESKIGTFTRKSTSHIHLVNRAVRACLGSPRIRIT